MTDIPGGENRRILVINDNRSIHDDFRKILSPAQPPPRPRRPCADADLFGSPAEGRRPNMKWTRRIKAERSGNGKEALEKSPLRGGICRREDAAGLGRDRKPRRIWEIDPDIQMCSARPIPIIHGMRCTKRSGNSDRAALLKKPFDTIELLRLANELTDKWWVAHFDRKKNLRRNADSK